VLNTAERVGKPDFEELFTDVWDELPWTLQSQREALRQHLDRHKEHYAPFLKQRR